MQAEIPVQQDYPQSTPFYARVITLQWKQQFPRAVT